MASVQETLTRHIGAAPMLYKSGADVLDYLLLVGPQRYVWQYGEVVDTMKDMHRERYTVERRVAELRANFAGTLEDEAMERLVRNRVADEYAADAQVASEAEKRAGSMRMSRSVEFGLKSKIDMAVQAGRDPFVGSLIRQVPANVTDDWAEAVANMRALVFQHHGVLIRP